MLLSPPDCFSSLRRIQTPTTRLFSVVLASNFNSLSVTRRNRPLCKATLITDSNSFEVGRFIGSYGFMNVTRYPYPISTLGFYLYFLFGLQENKCINRVEKGKEKGLKKKKKTVFPVPVNILFIWK